MYKRQVPQEHENGLRHTAGALAAAHAGVNTDGSQFYIVPSDGCGTADPCHLDWEVGKDCSRDSCHTVYGYVTDGQNHVDAISKVETNSNRPVDPVRILSASVIN